MLFRNIARAFVKHIGNAVGFGLVGDIAIDVWDSWSQEGKDQQEKLAEVQQLAQQSAGETRELASTTALEVAADQPEAVRESLRTYLTQVPAMVRQSMRRPADPPGKTVPPGLAMTKPEDLLTFLPTKPSRFKIGDRPLPGVDWELVELLGVGGFGEVWKARNQYFDGVAPVALKFCLDPEASRTLRHEAAVLNQVMRQGKHAGIVQLQHSYLSANPPCLEYEYVQGGDLTGLIHDWHRTGSFSVEKVTAGMLQLAEIVGFAHRLDPPIVHRDLKPANILLQQGQGGTVQLKVADFGIGGVAASKAIKDSAKGLPEGLMMTAVATGTYTPHYASRQQMSGMAADPRDDVYALGIIWYQMVTGNLNADRPGGTRWKQKAAERGMKPELVDLLERCFEEEPDDRPRDAAELAERLKPLVGPVNSPSARAGPEERRGDKTEDGNGGGQKVGNDEDGSSEKPIRDWPEDKFLALLADTRKDKGPAEVAVVRRLIDWFKQQGLRVTIMKRGKASLFPMLDHHGKEHWMVVIRTDGRMEIPFQHMLKNAQQQEKRGEILRRLNAIPGISIPEEAISKRPSVFLSVFSNEAALGQFLEIYRWYLEQVRSASHGRGNEEESGDKTDKETRLDEQAESVDPHPDNDEAHKSLRPGNVAVEPLEQDLGILMIGEERQFELTLTNLGDHLLPVKIVVVDTPWLTLGEEQSASEQSFQLTHELKVPVYVRGAMLRAKNVPLEGKLVVDSNCGDPVTITVKCIVPVNPFPGSGPLAGACSPRQVAERAKDNIRTAIPFFENGQVAEWYQSNGWVYPVEGPTAGGIATVQQFFEALGLATPPKVNINHRSVTMQGDVGAQNLSFVLEVKTEEKRPVYAWGISNQTWLEVSRSRHNGQVAALTLIVPQVPDCPGETLTAQVTVQSNGNQQFIIPVTLLIGGNPVGQAKS